MFTPKLLDMLERDASLEKMKNMSILSVILYHLKSRQNFNFDHVKLNDMRIVWSDFMSMSSVCPSLTLGSLQMHMGEIWCVALWFVLVVRKLTKEPHIVLASCYD